MQFRDLKAQYIYNQKNIDSAIYHTLSSSIFIGGEEVRELERTLADYVGTKHCITCANGTDALQLALMAWDIGPGDAVFVPDFTFFSSGEVVSAVGATPVFVDVDPYTYNLSPDSLRKTLVSIKNETALRTRAVIAVDLYGLPANYTEIREICDCHDLLLLEDAAQGLGGSLGNKMAASFGDIGTTSFFPAKPFGCYGDGGAIFTDDDNWASLIRSYAVHGKGSNKYDNVRIGMNSRLDAIQAAVLSSKLPIFIHEEIDKVNKMAALYDANLQDLSEEANLHIPVIPDGYRSSWAQYTIQLPVGANRRALQNELQMKDIPTMVYYPIPMHAQAAFQSACLQAKSLNCTECLCKTVLSLPIGPYMTEDDVLLVCNSLNESITRI